MTSSSHPQESPILSILFCSFHHERGPIIVNQVSGREIRFDFM